MGWPPLEWGMEGKKLTLNSLRAILQASEDSDLPSK